MPEFFSMLLPSPYITVFAVFKLLLPAVNVACKIMRQFSTHSTNLPNIKQKFIFKNSFHFFAKQSAVL